VISNASVDPTGGRGRTREAIPPGAAGNPGLPEYPEREPSGIWFTVRHYWVDPGARGSWRPYWFIVVPYWAIAVVTGAAPAAWLIRRSTGGRRFGRGRCRTCGYDLRSSPERCPECGTPRARWTWQGFWGRF
jgi:hypothetical protein